VFLGHALLGFALAGGIALLAGRERERALALGAVAAAFATAPDVDMAYALVGVTRALTDAAGPLAIAGSFWQTGNLVHRSVTHSVLLALPIAAAAGLWVRGRERPDGGASSNGVAPLEDTAARPIAATPASIGAVVVLGALVIAVTAVSGPLGGAVAVVFSAAALLVTEAAVRRTALGPNAVVAAALVGLVSHPFGDLLTGEPPAFLYPLDAVVVSERVVLSSDPTLHLLGAFGAELAAIWLGAAVFLRLYRVAPRVAVRPRATLGAGYAAGAFVLPAPTLEMSYPFVFTVLAVGLLGVAPRVRLVSAPGRPRIELPSGTAAAVTGLATVTVAWAAYSVAYLVL
jgi:membrane-bound metal-dependent hydrolase YbcI (DUF457 family)